MSSEARGKPRIVIYGAGQFGAYLTRLAVEKGWAIVAAFNRAGAKVGQDLGRLAGLDHDLGVVVQDCETASYAALDADLAFVTTANSLKGNMPAYRRLLGAGLNILCLAGEACYPQGIDAALAAEIDRLARRNGVTFTGGGVWDMSRIWSGILATGPCTEIESLYHRSITDCARQIISVEQAHELAIGITEAEFWSGGHDANPIGSLYKTIAQQVFHAIGYTVAETTVRVEPVILATPMRLHLLEAPIPAGHCAGMRIVCECRTREGPTARADIELRLFDEGEVEHMYWSVRGRPQVNIRVERADSAHFSAASLLNRAPDVIAARPGIVLLSELGPLRHSALA